MQPLEETSKCAHQAILSFVGKRGEPGLGKLHAFNEAVTRKAAIRIDIVV